MEKGAIWPVVENGAFVKQNFINMVAPIPHYGESLLFSSLYSSPFLSLYDAISLIYKLFAMKLQENNAKKILEIRVRKCQCPILALYQFEIDLERSISLEA